MGDGIVRGRGVERWPWGRQRALDLRRFPTRAEALAWSILRGRKVHGLKFRRQQRVGRYILDFYCVERRVAVEIEGRVHDRPDQKKRDGARMEALAALGIRVVRIRNEDVSVETLTSLLSPFKGAEQPPLALQGEGAGG